MLGLSQVMGTVEKGKMANLVVSDKHYFAEKSNVRMVSVNGALFEYEAPKPAPAALAAKPEGAPKPGGSAVAGKWSYSINVQGDAYDGVLNLSENAGAVSGIWSSDRVSGDNAITNPELKGTRLTFSSAVEMQGMNMTLGFDLQFEGASFSGKVSVPSFGTFDIKGSRQGGGPQGE
jgi:hypothetical protein